MILRSRGINGSRGEVKKLVLSKSRTIIRNIREVQKTIRPRTRSRHRLNTQGNETQVETMRAGLAINQEAEWLRAGEGNEQSATGQMLTETGSAGKQETLTSK